MTVTATSAWSGSRGLRMNRATPTQLPGTWRDQSLVVVVVHAGEEDQAALG
jgi:uncharacterized protein (DUF1684 family)